MKRFFVVFAVISTVLLPLSVNAENGREEGAKSQRGDSGDGGDVAGRYLRTLLSNMGIKGVGKAKPVEVSFSQSWVDSQPVAKGGAEWACLSEALYFEARGETVKGQFAVGEVILNRAKSSQFPATLCAVINQGTGRKYQCQFTYTCDGYKDVVAEHKAYERVSKVARAIIDGHAKELTDGAMYYHSTAVRPRWAKTFTQTARIGVHIFYRPKYRTAQNE